MDRWIRIAAVLALGAWMVACASPASPQEAITRAEVSIRKADEVGASQVAALDLLKAREKLENARDRARHRGSWTEARRLAEQAEVDAQLAEERARALQAEENAREMQRSIEILREEISRHQRGQ